MTEAKALQWDLELLLENKSLDWWIDSYFRLQEKILEKYTKDLFLSAKKLSEFHRLQRECSILGSRIRTYIFNSKNVDQFNNKWFQLEQELVERSTPFAKKLADFCHRAIKHQKEIKSYFKDPSFAQFRRMYELIFKYKKHILPPSLAKFELNFAPLADSYSEVFGIISEQEFKLQDVADSKGNKLTILTYADYLKHMKSEDRTFRENLYFAHNKFVSDRKESLFRLMYYHFLSENIDSKNISFPGGYIENALYSDEIDSKLLFSFYENMKTFQPLVLKFRKIRQGLIKKTHGIDEYKDWDRYLDIKISQEQRKYSIKEVREILLTALSVLGEDYLKDVRKILDSRWIDWLSRHGKTGGAYFSGGSYRLPGKFILLNYNGHFDDVLCVAHEIGHAVHDMKIDELDTYYFSPTIFIAEIPSVLNEILVNHHLLLHFREKNDKLQLLNIYDHLISTFVNTSIVQLAYSEWEYFFSKGVLDNSVVHVDDVISEYERLISLYIGKKFDKEKDASSWESLYKILTVPHFYSGEFYLYKYSVGLITSVLLSKRIMNPAEREKAVSEYYKFLRSGDSLSNLDSISLLSISLQDPSIWAELRSVFESWLEEYAKLSKEIYGVTVEDA